LADPSGVLVVAEVSDDGNPAGVTAELMTLAVDLSSEGSRDISAVVIGDKVEEAAKYLVLSGLISVRGRDASLARYRPEAFVAAVVAAAGATTRR